MACKTQLRKARSQAQGLHSISRVSETSGAAGRAQQHHHAGHSIGARRALSSHTALCNRFDSPSPDYPAMFNPNLCFPSMHARTSHNGICCCNPKLHLCLKTARYTEKGASGKVRENEDTSLGSRNQLAGRTLVGTDWQAHFRSTGCVFKNALKTKASFPLQLFLTKDRGTSARGKASRRTGRGRRVGQ